MKNAIVLILPYLFFVSFTGVNQSGESMQVNSDKDTVYFNSGYSVVNGIKMYYELHGNKGDYLVLIHGGGSTINTTFGKILPLLAPYYRIVALELQAHGHTGDRNEPESFEQDADDVASLLHNLHIPGALIFGFSNGGNTAMQLAVRHPEIVKKLVLASTFYKRDGLLPGMFEGLKNASLKDMPQLLKDAFLQINPDSSALLNMFNKDRERMLNFIDWKDDVLQSIKVPALIICGDRDVVTVDHTSKMARLIKNSRLVILPAEHGSYIGAAETSKPGDILPGITAEIIKDFFNQQR